MGAYRVRPYPWARQQPRLTLVPGLGHAAQMKSLRQALDGAQDVTAARRESESPVSARDQFRRQRLYRCSNRRPSPPAISRSTRRAQR